MFDVPTFVTLLWIFHAGPDTFRTGWLVESLLTELVVALVVRTRRPFFKSRPGTLLLVSTVCLLLRPGLFNSDRTSDVKCKYPQAGKGGRDDPGKHPRAP